ncbi:hypothetical protein SAMN05216403_10642 [Nitrosospira multiformis ATCC 25196]|uniref:Uncharacterized protein n=1 Tax=Nitrosospira multiformis (strain ATCC 25196 / NCIMB 11849 / C 71) TaxID=323848 RepID=A0A1H5U2S5_NITMU|nr:hypothetical protein SAMN05216403_10642 [Nitrosospira multiformis ATCC 25196]
MTAGLCRLAVEKAKEEGGRRMRARFHCQDLLLHVSPKSVASILKPKRFDAIISKK